MPKNKKVNTNIFDDSEYEVVDAEFNQDIINDFSQEIESSINKVIGKNLDSEYKLELMTVLLSFSAQVAADIDIIEDSFLELSSALYTEAKEETEIEIEMYEEDDITDFLN